jgi:hypothetical protein
MIQPWIPAAAAAASCPDAPTGSGGPYSAGEYYNTMIAPLGRLAPAAVITKARRTRATRSATRACSRPRSGRGGSCLGCPPSRGRLCSSSHVVFRRRCGTHRQQRSASRQVPLSAPPTVPPPPVFYARLHSPTRALLPPLVCLCGRVWRWRWCWCWCWWLVLVGGGGL